MRAVLSTAVRCQMDRRVTSLRFCVEVAGLGALEQLHQNALVVMEKRNAVGSVAVAAVKVARRVVALLVTEVVVLPPMLATGRTVVFAVAAIELAGFVVA